MELFLQQNNKKQFINITVKPAHSFLSRLRGLLGTTSIAENASLWIKPCTSIHMFGMLYSIDVIFLTENNEINKIATGVMPFGFSNGPKGTYSVLEMKKGTAERLKFKVGDRLVFE